MRIHFLLSFCIIFLFLICNQVFAQSSEPKTYSKRELQKNPVWIELMNDPNANYYETIRAFREFWKDRVLPKEPFENGVDQFEIEVGLVKGNESEEREREEEKERNADPKKREESMLYAAQVRAFKGWLQEVKPWVRNDGSIIGMAERQAIIDRQAKDLKEIENKQGK